MLNGLKKKRRPAMAGPLAVPELPDWAADTSVIAARAKLAELEAMVAHLPQALPELRARQEALQLALGERGILMTLGVADTGPEAEADAVRVATELADTISQIRRTETALETAQRGLEAARAVLPKIETQARRRVMDKIHAIYLAQARRFTATLEQASAEQEVLYALYPRILAQFPAWYEALDGEGVPQALGLPAPMFDELRPPRAVQAAGDNHAPSAGGLWRWWRSMANVDSEYGGDDPDAA